MLACCDLPVDSATSGMGFLLPYLSIMSKEVDDGVTSHVDAGGGYFCSTPDWTGRRGGGGTEY